MQDRTSIKYQQIVNHVAGVNQREEVDNDITDGNPQHEIWDAFVAVSVEKASHVTA